MTDIVCDRCGATAPPLAREWDVCSQCPERLRGCGRYRPGVEYARGERERTVAEIVEALREWGGPSTRGENPRRWVANRAVEFIEARFSPAAPSEREDAKMSERMCHEDMGSDPCGKPAVGERIDPEFGTPYPVCREHLRPAAGSQGGQAPDGPRRGLGDVVAAADMYARSLRKHGMCSISATARNDFKDMLRSVVEESAEPSPERVEASIDSARETFEAQVEAGARALLEVLAAPGEADVSVAAGWKVPRIRDEFMRASAAVLRAAAAVEGGS